MTGIVAAVVANYSMMAPKTPRQPMEFMPCRQEGDVVERAKPKRKHIDRHAVASEMRGVISALRKHLDKQKKNG